MSREGGGSFRDDGRGGGEVEGRDIDLSRSRVVGGGRTGKGILVLLQVELLFGSSLPPPPSRLPPSSTLLPFLLLLLGSCL